VLSSSLVPDGDATLLFTNSGTVQFKDVLISVDKRLDKRAIDPQEHIRMVDICLLLVPVPEQKRGLKCRISLIEAWLG
jgi:hypothetical protein